MQLVTLPQNLGKVSFDNHSLVAGSSAGGAHLCMQSCRLSLRTLSIFHLASIILTIINSESAISHSMSSSGHKSTISHQGYYKDLYFPLSCLCMIFNQDTWFGSGLVDSTRPLISFSSLVRMQQCPH